MKRNTRKNDPNDLQEYRPGLKKIAKGVLNKGKPAVHIRFPAELFDQVRKEALRRGISFNAMTVELIRAGIAP